MANADRDPALCRRPLGGGIDYSSFGHSHERDCHSRRERSGQPSGQDPIPAGAHGRILPRTTQLLAVGFVDTNGSLAFPVADHWNGASWKLLHPQIPAGAVDSFLSAVSCSGVGACLATGYWVDETFAWHTLAEGWDGTGWAIQATRTPGVEKAFTGVSCPTATACTAVGDHFIETWDGSSWTLQPLPLAANGVSCPTTTFCMAVGKSAAMWNGTAWTLDPPVFPTDGSTAYLTSVSCSSQLSCLATGTYIATLPTGNVVKVVADVWNGQSWTLVSPDAVTSFNGVSCPFTRACMAVGTADSGTLAQSWNGATWTYLNPIDPSGVSDSLFGVSCVGTGCMHCRRGHLDRHGDEHPRRTVGREIVARASDTPPTTAKVAGRRPRPPF